LLKQKHAEELQGLRTQAARAQELETELAKAQEVESKLRLEFDQWLVSWDFSDSSHGDGLTKGLDGVRRWVQLKIV
jgi:hypothetical protein